MTSRVEKNANDLLNSLCFCCVSNVKKKTVDAERTSDLLHVGARAEPERLPAAVQRLQPQLRRAVGGGVDATAVAAANRRRRRRRRRRPNVAQVGPSLVISNAITMLFMMNRVSVGNEKQTTAFSISNCANNFKLFFFLFYVFQLVTNTKQLRFLFAVALTLFNCFSSFFSCVSVGNKHQTTAFSICSCANTF